VTDAGRLRLEGRWDAALESLADRDDVDAAIERVRTLADVNMLARDTGAELESAIDTVSRLGGDDRRVEAFVLSRRGQLLHVAFLQDRDAGEPPGEMQFFEQALAIRRELGDERDIAESLFHVGLVHQVVRGDSPASVPWFEESYELARRAGDEILMSYSVRHLAFAHGLDGDHELAGREFLESLELRERAGWIAGVPPAQLALAEHLAETGRREEAQALAETACATLRDLGAERFLAVAETIRSELGS
jgi:tetratricopeptide (TPR) repeat protein